MKLNSFVVNTTDIKNTRWLSLRPFSCHFSKYEYPNFIRKYCSVGYESLGKFVIELRSGSYIAKKNYCSYETNYVYMNVGNFSKGDIDFISPVYLDNDIGEQYESIKVNPGDMIITRSGTVGCIAIFNVPTNLIDKTFIPSHHLAIIQTSTPNEMLFLKYYLTYPFCKNFFDAYSTGKVQKEITNWSIRKIPIPSALDKSTLENEFQTIDFKIKKVQSNVVSLQTSIDQILTKYKIKSKSSLNYRTDCLLTNLSHISKNKALRIGAQYNNFWITHNGQLFSGTDEDITLMPLKKIMKLSQKSRLKKGSLDEPRILIDFDQVESMNGKILDFDNQVTYLGSDRIEFGECDILTNKLRPYLGYTILNIPDLKLIGTTEFIPFEIRDKNVVMPEYVRYILLSTEYLEKSKLLISGKEHPRISSIDILNITIPVPDITVQARIVKEIQDKENQSDLAREKIKNLQNKINYIIETELSKIIGS